MFTQATFSNWDLSPEILEALAGAGFEFATQVQRDTIPIALSGRDVIGQARTGSGKTAAFGLPVLNACTPNGQLQALMLTPTRELAVQVAKEIEMLQGDSGFSIMTVYGGTDLEKQAKSLAKGVDIIVGTPGRVMDMTKRGHIDLAKPTWLVLDEADRMLDMGFFPDIMWVLEKMESRSQTLLFSATFPQEILDASYEFMNDPEFVLTQAESLDIPEISQHSVRCGRANKLWVCGRILAQMGEADQTIIFANTKRMVDLMVQRLNKHRFEADGLHGDLNQNQRERILEKFRSGDLSIIVATDVASRGIDVDGVTCVINYDVPDDVDSYVHRIGRTGRIGRKGQAWTLVSRDDIPQMNKIQATHSLDIVASEAPELPDGISRDPVNKQMDNSEVSDVFGMVPILISTDSLSKLKISEWLVQNIRCDPLAIGTITVGNGSSMIEVHNRSVEHALKAFNSKSIYGQQLKAAVIE